MPQTSRSDLFVELTKLYRERLSRPFMSQDQEHRDDVHDAFIRTIEASEKSTIRDPSGFVIRTMRNLFIDRLRSKNRENSYFTHEETSEIADLTPSPERAAIAADRFQRVIRIIEVMPEKRRQVFLLHRIDDLTYAQIARKMHISVKMVEKHMAAAMAQLFTSLAD